MTQHTKNPDAQDPNHEFPVEVASLLKVLGHQGRLTIVSHLVEGEKTVSQLQALMQAPQPVVSSHLARLRFEGVVASRKDGKNKVYALKDNNVRQILGLVNTMFCGGLSQTSLRQD